MRRAAGSVTSLHRPATSSTMSERLKINVRGWLWAVTFSANGEYVLSGGQSGVQVWRVEDGKQMATMDTKTAFCLAVSKDGRWIAAGTLEGDVHVWDANTYKQVWTHRQDSHAIHGVHFSPDSTRFVSVSRDGTAIVWDIATRKKVRTLHSKGLGIAAKYSPQGDRIATATRHSVQVYDSNDGRLLMDIKVGVTPSLNTSLLWFDNHLLVISDGKIKQFEASTGSVISEWPLPDTRYSQCIAIPKHREFIAYSAERTVTFWDTSTHAQLGRIQHPQAIYSIAVSPDDFIAVGGDAGTITIESLSPIADSILLSHLHPTFREPDFQIDDAVLDLWKQDQLTNAEALLTAAITAANTNHHLLASRALVRARLQEWDTALADAEMAINLQPSAIGYIAKSIALVGKGERHKGYRACDIAFERFHSSHVTFLLLTKAIVVFMAGEHHDAISRVDDIISTVRFNSICYIVQAYMYLLVGNSRMECHDYEGAIQSFECAQAQMQHHASRPLSMISLISGWKFDHLGTVIQQRLCEALYEAGRTKDAVECFNQMASELEGEINLHGEQFEWTLDFRQRSSEKSEHLGDTAVDSQRHDEAISHYTTALSLDPPSPQGILIKRSKALTATGSWKQALDDANQVINLDPSSPWGYGIKHAALHKAGHYDDAVDAFETMLSKIAQSPDLDIQRHGDQYISPSSTRARICRIVQRILRHSPRVLINTSTGRLLNKAEQAFAFESLPIFKELVSSMTTRTDYVRIKHEVRQYFRYVMLSHNWEATEPLFQQVIHVAVYDLEMSPTHDKLQTFCKIVRDAGFHWAWSDTCCIDKSNHFVLQEALVAMFKWYQGSAMMIVFLRGVRPSERGALVRSIWNTRGWTLQEYVAAKVIHFYTEDWTLYLDLELPNHKESPEVISEMEQATGVSAQQLMALRPGLTSIRDKLRLASTRHTTLVEDAAYSLLGIFSVTGIPAIYGEGEGALGRLLAHVLTGSGDVSILAWTGESGSFNSCLPAHITVFNGPATSHLPLPIQDAEVDRLMHSSSFDLDEALSLYDCLNILPAPWFAASRMKLPCIAFELPPLSPFRTRSGRVYRADTLPFGTVEIRTRHDLSRMQSLYLVHPWLDSLLEREDMHSHAFVEDDVAPPPSLNTDDEEIWEEIGDDCSLPVPELPSELPTPVRMAPMDRETRARQLVVRLRQPFGALLVTLAATNRRAMDYRRVAADSLITVRFQENVPLADILANVCTLDIL
ncbi:hypothetical protein HD554DRAFT_1425706 [Boletus coccyginus]|nr:hypothetical protein HD554DRAFT_1425706 [Boletus coccyginus]